MQHKLRFHQLCSAPLQNILLINRGQCALSALLASIKCMFSRFRQLPGHSTLWVSYARYMIPYNRLTGTLIESATGLCSSDSCRPAALKRGSRIGLVAKRKRLDLFHSNQMECLEFSHTHADNCNRGNQEFLFRTETCKKDDALVMH